MLRNAPKFYEVAKRIVEITEDCILWLIMPNLITEFYVQNLND